MGWHEGWPEHVWAGTTVENQDAAEERIPSLVRVPARVRFLSVEPLLGPVNLGLIGTLSKDVSERYALLYEALHWVIVGGESGPGARPIEAAWVRQLRDECIQVDVPFFFKQWGGVHKKTAGRELDGREWSEVPR
jgi:protein gp37